jgi:glycosyltransferase involved in cell wall biosynthesis
VASAFGSNNDGGSGAKRTAVGFAPAFVRETTVRLGVLCDLLEERWFSMDLLADMLIENAGGVPSVGVTRVRPSLPSGLARLLVSSGSSVSEPYSRKLGLALGRYVGYPLALASERARFDWFHVVDHSYAHLVLGLRQGRCGVYCHDVDAFRPLFDEPERALPHRALARLILAGFRRARVVFHSTLAVRDDILEHRLVPRERLVHAPYGVAPEFEPKPGPADEALRGRTPFVLHVGSLIPRKNPEFLLALIVEILKAMPALEVVQVGGSWTREQRQKLEREGLIERVQQFESMNRAELAPYYRAAKAVLLPSTNEGFGLPVVEALACGTPVVASDIPVLTQVGGSGAVFCPVNDLAAWKSAISSVVGGRGPDRDTRLRAARRFTWSEHAKTILGTYAELSAREAD